jgi:hypothetical protein
MAWHEIIDQLGRISSSQISEYVQKSDLLDLNEQLGILLTDSKWVNPFAKPLTMENVIDGFSKRLDVFLST